MQALWTSLILVLVFAGIVATLSFAYGAWQRIRTREVDLQIWRVMARRKVAADPSPAGQAKLARAVRRCVLCPSIEECDHWLASDGNAGLAEFCPNANMLDGRDVKSAK